MWPVSYRPWLHAVQTSSARSLPASFTTSPPVPGSRQGLRPAIKDMFGGHALVHRCHRPNVIDLLSERERAWPDAAASLREGLPEKLTLMRLGISSQLSSAAVLNEPM